MVTVKLDEYLDELEWGALIYCGLSKEVDGGSISNGESGG